MVIDDHKSCVKGSVDNIPDSGFNAAREVNGFWKCGNALCYRKLVFLGGGKKGGVFIPSRFKKKLLISILIRFAHFGIIEQSIFWG